MDAPQSVSPTQPDLPPGRRRRPGIGTSSSLRGLHIAYLAVIVVLVIVIVFLGAKAYKARRALKEVAEHFGILETARSSIPRKGGAALRNATPEELTTPRSFDERRREVDSLVQRALDLEEFGPASELSEACAHALAGGKRLRPIIILEITRRLNEKAVISAGTSADTPALVDAADGALFMEYLHTASLVIDDHPDFDDDAVRRQQASLHVKTGPAVAQMAAISMVAAAFQNICRQIDWIRDNCPQVKNVDRMSTLLCNDVSRAIGACGAAGGQYMDGVSLAQLQQEYGGSAIMDIMYKKTATFFEISFITGWLIGGGAAERLDEVRDAGRNFGIAFQIADDIGDTEEDQQRQLSGKPGWNFALYYGEEAALREVEQRLNACRLILARLDLWTPLWDEIYQKVWGMAAR